MLDRLFSEYEPVIDRPKGSVYPQYSDYIYPTYYGFLKGTVLFEGAGIDVFVGSIDLKRSCSTISSFDFIKEDSKIKILYRCIKKRWNRFIKSIMV